METKYFAVWMAFVDCFAVGEEDSRWIRDCIESNVGGKGFSSWLRGVVGDSGADNIVIGN